MLDWLLLIFAAGGLVCILLGLLRKGMFPAGLAGWGICTVVAGAVNLFKAFAYHRGTLLIAASATEIASAAFLAWLALTGRWKRSSFLG